MVSGTRENPPPLPSYPGRGNCYLISLQTQPVVYIRVVNPSQGARELGWASCFACHVMHTFSIKAEIPIKDVKINSAKPTVIALPRETQRKRDMNIHAG